MDEHPIYLPAPPRDRSQAMARAVALLVLAGLVLLVCFLGYEFLTVSTQNNQLKASNAQLQQKVDKLNKQLGNTGAATGTTVNPNSSITPLTCKATTPTQAEEDALAADITAGNYNDIKNYMAAKVAVVIAAQDKSGDETPAQAVTDLKTLSNATAPWNFDLSGDTLGTWRANGYAQYFTDTSFAGESTDKQVVSFQFDTCAKVMAIFISPDASYLEQ